MQIQFLKIRYILFLLYFTTTLITGKAQQPIYYQKNLINNYPINTINTDLNGRIWLGTNSGLYLYDGKKTSSPITELTNCKILNTLLDEKNENLWIYSRKEFGVLNLKTFKFKVVKRFVDYDPYISPSICTVKNIIYTIFNDGNICGFSEDGTLVQSIKLPTFGLNKNTPLLTIHNNRLIVLVNNKSPLIIQIDLNKNKIVKYTSLGFKTQSYLGITQIASFQDKIFFASFDKGYFFLDIEHDNKLVEVDTISKMNIANGAPYLFFISSNNCLYLTYKNGSIYRFKDDLSHPITITTKSINFPIYYSLNALSTNNGFLLLGDKNGLQLIAQKNIQFHSILTNETISTRNIISDGDNGLFIASYSGLFHYNVNSHHISVYDRFYTTWVVNKWIHKFAIYSLWTDRSSPFLYLGSEGFPFFRFNKKTFEFETLFYKHPDFGASGFENVYSIVKIKNKDQLLIGYQHGLALFDLKANELVLLKNSYFNKKDLQILKIIPNGDNDFIVCTKFGLYDYNSKYTIKYNRIGSMQVNDCVIDKYKNRWIATEYNGIIILNKDGEVIKRFNSNNGLPSDGIATMVNDKKGSVWVATQNGLVKINENDYNVIKFNLDEGLSTNEFNKASIYCDDKNLYVGSINGVNIYNLNQKINEQLVSINFNYLEIWREKKKYIEYIYQNNFSKKTPIKIYPGDRIMNMSFGLSDIKNIDNNQYEYRISNVDSIWRTFDYQEKLNFFKLNYGQFTIEIRGYNTSHVRSGNTILIAVDVIKPFYLRWWFILAMFFLLFLIILGYYKIKLRNYKDLQNQRVLIASNLHDDIGGILSAIQLELENYKLKNINNYDLVQINHIEKLSRSASNAVYESLWMIDSRNDTIDNLLDKLYETSDLILIPINIKPQYIINVDNYEEIIKPHLRQQLYYIFKESLNNIVKHSHPTHIIIEIKKNSFGFNIKIRNNGILTSETPRLTGMGLDNMQERAKSINYKLNFKFEDRWALLILMPL